MNTNTNEVRSMITPVFVLFCSVALVCLAAMILRDPSRAGSDLVMVSPGNDLSIHPTPVHRDDSAQSTTPSTALAAAEDQLVKNMAYFDSRFERYTAELQLEEEKALSRSDLVGTRYQIKSLQEDLASLQTLSTEWTALNTELLTNVTGSQIASSPELLANYLVLADTPRLSARDLTELTERLQPLSDFVVMLEDQDTVAYEPSERFQSRLTSMVRNVEKATEELKSGLFELKRLQRAAQPLGPVEETLEEVLYRKRRELSATATDLATPSFRFEQDTVEPPESSPDEKPSPEPRQKEPTAATMTAESSEEKKRPRIIMGPNLLRHVQQTNEATDDSGSRLNNISSQSIQPDAEGNYLPANFRKPIVPVESPRAPPQSTKQPLLCSKCGRVWTLRTLHTTRRCSSYCQCQ